MNCFNQATRPGQAPCIKPHGNPGLPSRREYCFSGAPLRQVVLATRLLEAEMNWPRNHLHSARRDLVSIRRNELTPGRPHLLPRFRLSSFLCWAGVFYLSPSSVNSKMTARMPDLSCASVQTASEQTFRARMTSRSGFFAPPGLAELNDSLDVYPKCRTLRDVWLNKYPLRAMASSTTVRDSAFSFGVATARKSGAVYTGMTWTCQARGCGLEFAGTTPYVWVYSRRLPGGEKERRATNLECESEADNRGQLSDFLDSRARIVQPGRSREALSFRSHRAQVGWYRRQVPQAHRLSHGPFECPPRN